MTTKKKTKTMTHEEAFFYILACAKAYYEWSRQEDAEWDRRTKEGKMIACYAHYIDKLHGESNRQGVPI